MPKESFVFVNVILAKPGQIQDFAKIQIADFEKFGGSLDGSLSNEFYLSVNEGNDGHCINIAHFESIEAYYQGTSTPVFKAHIERIKPYLKGTQPMLLKKVWSRGDSQEAINFAIMEQVPKLLEENCRLENQFGAPKLEKE